MDIKNLTPPTQCLQQFEKKENSKKFQKRPYFSTQIAIFQLEISDLSTQIACFLT